MTNDFTPDIPSPRRLGCTSYAAGHNVHFIQALHTANHPEIAVQTWPGELLAIDGQVLVVHKRDGGLVRYRNHDPARLAAVRDAEGTEVWVNDQYSILRVGAFCFSLAHDRGEQLGACATDDTGVEFAVARSSWR
jgi:hypothetical protein